MTLFGLAAASLARDAPSRHRRPGDRVGNPGGQSRRAASETLLGPTVNSITPADTVHLNSTAGRFRCSDRRADARSPAQPQRLPFEITLGYSRAREARTLHAINLVVQRSYSGIGCGGEGQSALVQPFVPAVVSVGHPVGLEFLPISAETKAGGYRATFDASSMTPHGPRPGRGLAALPGDPGNGDAGRAPCGLGWPGCHPAESPRGSRTAAAALASIPVHDPLGR